MSYRRPADLDRATGVLRRAPAEAETRPPRRMRWALRLSERKMLLYMGDMLAVNAALLATLWLRLHMGFDWHTILRRPGWFVLVIVLWAVCAPLLNTYDLRAAARVSTGAATGAGTTAVVSVAFLLTPYISPPLLMSRLTAFTFLGLSVGAVAAWRAAYAGLFVQPTFRHRAIIVGAGWAGRVLADVLRTHAATEYDLVGFIDDDPVRARDRIGDLAVIGTSAELVDLVRARDVSEVIVAVTHQETISSGLIQALLRARESGVQIAMMQAVYERLTGKVPVEHTGHNFHLVLSSERDPNRLFLLLKRVADVAIGLVGAALMVGFMPLVAVAIALENPGPVFYRQDRVGQGGRVFALYKFRTMVPHAEPRGPQWAQEDDARITRVGRVLRRLHLDELPQAINLLRGEMAFIGPRPERPEFVAELERIIPFYRARHAMRPGVTGWAQVNYRYGRSVEDALIKLQYDLYYVKHCSLVLDAVILVRTLARVVAPHD
ncbi:MAG: sugar transferase [Armatimonadota bacterium]|nr:sugar transferase [Armatimonadota bacterium]